MQNQLSRASHSHSVSATREGVSVVIARSSASTICHYTRVCACLRAYMGVSYTLALCRKDFQTTARRLASSRSLKFLRANRLLAHANVAFHTSSFTLRKKLISLCTRYCRKQLYMQLLKDNENFDCGFAFYTCTTLSVSSYCLLLIRGTHRPDTVNVKTFNPES